MPVNKQQQFEQAMGKLTEKEQKVILDTAIGCSAVNIMRDYDDKLFSEAIKAVQTIVGDV